MASATGEISDRANIRIEIKNDISEKMDTNTLDGEIDEEENASDVEMEEGEISDGKENEDIQQTQKKDSIFNRNVISRRGTSQWTSSDGGFTTGVNIFDKDEQEKMQNRAQRFGLDPSDRKGMNDQQLQELHDSLGLTEEDLTNSRLEAIHMYGTQEMSTQDIFAYFGKYGPSSIEWINDESCNVVWFDSISAARALHGLSKPISGMPVIGTCDPFQKAEKKVNRKKEHDNRSILIISKDQVPNDDGAINIDDIDIPIPPGYWRLGEQDPKAKFILLRFAKRTDKKPFRAEKFSNYYKKYGNPNYGGLKGIISDSKKKQMRGGPTTNPAPEDAEIKKGNPWGSLAQNWGNEAVEKPREEAKLPIKSNKSILNRLGTSRKRPIQKRSDDENNDDDDDIGDNVDNEYEPTKKKSKVPRMRMYADEEEARVKRERELKKIRKLEEIEKKMTDDNHTVPDLRNRINNSKQNRHPSLSSSSAAAASSLTRLKLSSRDSALIDSSSSSGRLRPVKQEITISARNDMHVISSGDEDIEMSADNLNNVQQRSKVTVVVKKQPKPTMASTIWSRLHHGNNKSADNDGDGGSSGAKPSVKNNLTTNSNNKRTKSHASRRLGPKSLNSDNEISSDDNANISKEGSDAGGKNNSSSSSSSSDDGSGSNSSSSSSSGSGESSDSDTDVGDENVTSKASKNNYASRAINHRPGFNKSLKSRLGIDSSHKSPLRIEISNDHFKRS